MRGDDVDVERAIAVARPVRDDGTSAGRRWMPETQAGAPLQGGAEAGVGGVPRCLIVHDAGDGVVAALDVAVVLAGKRVVAGLACVGT